MSTKSIQPNTIAFHSRSSSSNTLYNTADFTVTLFASLSVDAAAAIEERAALKQKYARTRAHISLTGPVNECIALTHSLFSLSTWDPNFSTAAGSAGASLARFQWKLRGRSRGGVRRDGERAPTISIRAGIFGSSRLPREYTTLLCSNNVIPRLSLDKSVSQSVSGASLVLVVLVSARHIAPSSTPLLATSLSSSRRKCSLWVQVLHFVFGPFFIYTAITWVFLMDNFWVFFFLNSLGLKVTGVARGVLLFSLRLSLGWCCLGFGPPWIIDVFNERGGVSLLMQLCFGIFAAFCRLALGGYSRFDKIQGPRVRRIPCRANYHLSTASLWALIKLARARSRPCLSDRNSKTPIKSREICFLGLILAGASFAPHNERSRLNRSGAICRSGSTFMLYAILLLMAFESGGLDCENYDLHWW